MKDFLSVMEAREQVAQVTHRDELMEHLQTGQRTAYIGFDPTADSLHVGSLTPLIALRRFQKAGHRVIVVLGSGTAMVGDPSGKTDMRQMLTEEKIDQNREAIRTQIMRFVDLSDPKKGILVDNGTWLKSLNLLSFLRDIGPHFSVNRMLTAESYRQRMEKGLSFLELTYMILQSYDFLHLFKTEACSLQMGGDDQWSNILGGMELVRRLVPGGKAYALTFPLLETSDGKKMGKTEKGAVWLDEQKTSPFEFYQFWRNVEDKVLRDCLLRYTDFSLEEIKSLMSKEGAELNEVKALLAYEVTKDVHGEVHAQKAKDMALSLFQNKSGDAPRVTFDWPDQGGEELELLEILLLSNVIPSKAEGRRLITQGGLYVEQRKVENVQEKVTKQIFESGDGLLVKKGKKNFYRILLNT